MQLRIPKGGQPVEYGMTVLDNDLMQGVRAARNAFFERVDPVRPELHRYCRRLTGDIWEAEDLVQETLTRAFSRAADSFDRIDRVLPWLVRIATNAYIDSWRRSRPTPAEMPEMAAPDTADPLEVRDALTELATQLAPQERAAIVLKDVFDYPLADIARTLGTTVGAVKAALHRGRERLDGRTPARPRPKPDRAVIEALAAAFSAYDVEGIVALLLDGAESVLIGVVHEEGADAMRNGSLHHMFVVESDVRYRAEVGELDGEPLVLMWQAPVDGSLPEALVEVMRLETTDGLVSRMRWYYHCPETLAELGKRLAAPIRDHGYRF
ncbi:RNA polymerase sigma factor [Paractinoplanes hotanensis]|uniref:Sigma-70 family RNA polymerase sigma factor n=1 Tax=Paractinoplanes hotanensis TaxID=2906497 RepID=A0ABT0XWP1_9ACTN|nr:sigma-70 family RNA polymerase sigma factor [Actinoplanes hotanensis]MCM4078206.1 sigma-70 family RNA polymerase sigma factor [Actinoplanes hotanensis]